MTEPDGNPLNEAAGEAGSGLEHELTEGRNIALATLWTHYSRVPREEAENIAQELCIEYWKQRSRIRVFQSWFYTSARNRAISALRRKQPSRGVNERDAQTAEPLSARHETMRQLFFTLRGHCRQLLGCLVIDGWSLQEVARALSRDVNTLNEQRSRCLKSLRRRWLEAEAAAGKIPARLAG